MRKICQRKVITALFLSIALIALFSFIAISFYSRPSADDYAYSYECYNHIKDGNWTIISLLKTALHTDIQFYNTWQGLYTSAFLLALQPGIFGEQYYFIGTVLLIALMYICILYAIRCITKDIILPIRPAFLSLFIVLIFLEGLPSTVQGLYWFNGAWNYMPFFFLIMVNISFIINYYRSTTKIQIALYLFSSSILTFIISGGNHVTAFLNILLLIILFFDGFHRQKYLCSIPLIIAVLGFILVLASPGTAVREAELVQAGLPKQTVLVTMYRSLLYLYQRLSDWIDLQWILCIAAATPFAFFISRKNEKLRAINPIAVFLLSGMLLCGIFCVPYYAMGFFGDERVVNIFWLAFMALSLINWINLILWILPKAGSSLPVKIFPNARKKTITLCFTYLVILLGICFNANTNTISIVHEFRNGHAKRFAEKADERYAYMEEYPDCDLMIVNELPHSENLKLTDVSEDINDYRNVGWKDYYGVEIRLAHPGEEDTITGHVSHAPKKPHGEQKVR